MIFTENYPVQPGPSRATAGPGETFSWGPQTLSQGPSGEQIFEFFFSKWYTLAYFIFLANGGPPKRCGAQGSLPPTPSSRWACIQHSCIH